MNTLETLGQLERRLHVSVPLQQIDAEIHKRLQRLARTAKVPGFRPGKVPLKMIAQQYGPQVRSEVVSEAVQETFADAVRTQNLRVAGYPRIEPKATGDDAGQFEYSATFEVYPEVVIGDVSSVIIVKPVAQIGSADVEHTIEILRKQRVKYETIDRAAQDGDRVLADFSGKIDGVEFPGGQANDFAIILGEGRMLPEFEAALAGIKAGESKTFTLKFPDDYHGAEVAGKTAEFTLTVKGVAQPVLPDVDADFAKSLGVVDGDLDTLRAEIKANLEVELKRKIETRLREQVMQALKETSTLDVPRGLTEQEMLRMREQALAELKARGGNADESQVTPDMFRAAAEDRVRMGLVLSEVVSRNSLRAQSDQVRARVEEAAQTYEQPEAVVAWHYQEAGRLAEFEAQVVEHNVVEWVLGQAVVEEQATTFADLLAPQST
jgi:trigger factor